MVHASGGCQRGGLGQPHGEGWDERLKRANASLGRRPIFINVGANKGFNSASFMALWSGALTEQRWRELVLRYATERSEHRLRVHACGVCNPYCRFPKRADPVPTHDTAEVHLLELQASNRQLLDYLVNHSGMSRRMFVHDVGASNESSLVTIKSRGVGSEDGSIASSFGTISKERGSEAVRLVTIDGFLAELGLTHVYHLSIDTEGWDALVLEGMRASLRERRVAVLEFEYSGRGFWSQASRDPRTLGGTLAWLKQLGYTCFFQAPHDLIPASPPCWQPAFERRAWSNLLCAHSATALEVLFGIAVEGQARRDRECRSLKRMRGHAFHRSKDKGWCGSSKTSFAKSRRAALTSRLSILGAG